MGILDGKTVLVTGITLDTSIAFHVARIAQAEGATVLVSNFGRAMSLTRRVLQKLDPVPPLLEVDVTNADHLARVAGEIAEHTDRLDGLVHSLAYANPETALGGKFLSTPWEDVGQALHVSAYSLSALTMAVKSLLRPGSSVVGMTFDATVSWPVYDWMGVAKAALESTSRYLARYLGPDDVRVNLVAAGPIDTLAKKAIGGGSAFNDVWGERAPLGWDPKDGVPAAKAVVALLSDWFPRTTGEMVHVDGGLHSTGA
ncbi:enoyl-[acyl-carrier protein] reductase I [Friedmanniella endophytica]|uniref:Enoyl-[acyl-carrier-protein] reductase [NADH] n=1 Tax=Microlunatus kandeliicorticis TaxID=1759536 RepID=A0A7W3P5T9_9ACTN|nr:enoyl-ACP reductase FabI [Microlunatus kandeliicorticis]MBA8794220.1 enoyl-[acyl-carrier protein] reductase I [Microlunatus kandeliicorticis]